MSFKCMTLKRTFFILLSVGVAFALSDHTSADEKENPITPIKDTEQSEKVPKLMELSEMLAVGLKHNADVRAAEARVRAAEAELEQTRHAVMQKILVFRAKWEKKKQEVDVALRLVRVAKGNKAASSQYFRLRGQLKEIEAELPFLLGQQHQRRSPARASKSRKLIQDTMLPMARRLLRIRTREHETGLASIREVADAQRQVAELEVQLAETKSKRLAALESQREMLKMVRDIARHGVEAGTAPERDLLSAELEMAKLELWILEIEGE